KYLVANAHDLPFDDASFDVAVLHRSDRARSRPAGMPQRVRPNRASRRPCRSHMSERAISFHLRPSQLGTFPNGKACERGCVWVWTKLARTRRGTHRLGIRRWARPPRQHSLSKALVGLVEAYWASLVQSVVKANPKKPRGRGEARIEETRTRT